MLIGALQIEERLDDEGRIEIVNDDQLYELLGSRTEDEETEKEIHTASIDKDGDICDIDDTIGAAIIVDDYIPDIVLWFMIQTILVWTSAWCTLT